jgi:hypothetical protein
MAAIEAKVAAEGVTHTRLSTEESKFFAQECLARGLAAVAVPDSWYGTRQVWKITEADIDALEVAA